MIKIITLLVMAVSVVVFYSCTTTRNKVNPQNLTFNENVKPILTKHCTGCHAEFSGKEVVAGSMDSMISLIEKGIMPPKGEKPTAEEIAILKSWDRVR